MWAADIVLDRGLQKAIGKIRNTASPLGDAEVKAWAQCLAGTKDTEMLAPSFPYPLWPGWLTVLGNDPEHFTLPSKTLCSPSPSYFSSRKYSEDTLSMLPSWSHHHLWPELLSYHLHIVSILVICSYSLQSIFHWAAGRLLCVCVWFLFIVIKNMVKATIVTIFKHTLISIKYSHNVVQSSPLFLSRTFNHPK